jgi:cytochrome b subunit of formate dehydrogenase
MGYNKRSEVERYYTRRYRMRRMILGFTGLIMFLIFSFSPGAWAKEVPFTLEDRDRLIRMEATIKEFKEAVDKRFEQVDKRFEQVDKRFEQMIAFMWMLVVIFVGVTGSTIGFAIWDRRTMIRPFEVKTKEIEEKIKEMDEERLTKLIHSLREIAKVDSKVAEALKKFNLL